jgi:hypothetical protein
MLPPMPRSAWHFVPPFGMTNSGITPCPFVPFIPYAHLIHYLCGENFPYVFKGARSAPRAWRRGWSWARCRAPELGCELRPELAVGRAAPEGLSLLPVRPLRLRPKTATAGGRASVTPGTGPAPAGRRHAHRPRPARDTGAVAGGAPLKLRRPTAACRLGASPIPGADHCLSRPEPVKGAWRRPFGQPLTEPGRLKVRRLSGDGGGAGTVSFARAPGT